MKEECVSHKTALLLKEKGFHWPTCYWTLDNKVYQGTAHGNPIDHNMSQTSLSVPTQQMAMRWFREEKMIFISPFPTFKSGPTFKCRLPYSWRVDIKNCFGEELGGNYEYITYEDAVEAALEYCLTNLI